MPKKEAVVEEEEEEPFNPFGLPQRDEVTPTPQWADCQEPAPSKPVDTADTYARLIDLRDDTNEVPVKSPLNLAPPISQKPSNETKVSLTRRATFVECVQLAFFTHVFVLPAAV